MSTPASGLNLLLSTFLVERMEVGYPAAMAIGLLVQIAIESELNRRWTFREEELTYLRASIPTAAIEVACFVVALLVTSAGVEFYGEDFFWARLASFVVTGVLSLVCVFCLTFRRSKKPPRR